MMTDDTFALGQTGIRLSAIGMGAWQWGDRFTWGFGRGYDDSDIRTAFETALQAGVNWVDTAELYGPHTSERMLGQLVREMTADIRVATKCFPFPWRWSGRTLLRALEGSLKRLGLQCVDLYQMHWPYPPLPVESWMDGMAEAARRGLTRAVGVSNYNRDQVRRASDRLARHGLTLASNQIEYSLLHRSPERDGTLDACRERGVTVIAYSPIAKGVLSGKYTPDNVPPGLRGRWYPRDYLARVGPLIEQMRAIGQAHGAKSPTQVALNWLIAKSALPIPGAKNARQAGDNAGAMGWRLSAEEVRLLDMESEKVQ
jgi:aryl-alcohol dehydrogenase-like predicted oxidoreductase